MSATAPTAVGPGAVHLSAIGRQMAGPSGLRSIMDDVATTIADGGSATWTNLSVGNPARIPEVTRLWRDALEAVLRDDFEREVGGYGRSRGSTTLVEAVVDHFGRTYGWSLTGEHVVAGPGSQMICFAAAALFCGPSADGTTRRVVLPFQPDYTGYQGLCQHADGIVGIAPRLEPRGAHRFGYAMDVDAVAAVEDIGMMLVSSPGNPTGRAVTDAEVDALERIAEERQVPLILDHAYGAPFPRVGETHRPPREHPWVIHCFSASKAGMPGERTGIAIGDPRLTTPIASFFANAVLHAPQLGQGALAHVLRSGELDRVARDVIAPHYGAQRAVAEQCLDTLLPADVRWRSHTGAGMFSWLWFDEPWFDDLELYGRMKRENVFVVPGRHFFVDPSEHDHARRCVRLSLSAEPSVLRRGIEVLVRVVGEMRDAFEGGGRCD